MEATELISIANLANGEHVALGCIEVKAVPHYRVLDDSAVAADTVIERCVREDIDCLSEIHQLYKPSLSGSQHGCDLSVELLWTTHRVSGQPYKATIRLFLVARAISRDASDARALVDDALSCLRATLSSQRYDMSTIDYGSLSEVISTIESSSIRAVVREERLSNLQNSILPACLVFDRLQSTLDDLSRIVLALSEHPSCALAIHLIPTTLSSSEAMGVDSLTQSLGMLAGGVQDRYAGNVSFALAKGAAETYEHYSQRKTAPLFLANVVIYGDKESAAALTSRVIGRLSSADNTPTNLKYVSLPRSAADKDTNFYPLPWAINEALLRLGRDPQIWSSKLVSQSLYRLPYIFTAEESAELFRIPIGSDRVAMGLTVNEASRQGRSSANDVVDSGDIVVGNLGASGGQNTIGFSLNDLSRHMLVVGTPGSGKTTFLISLLDRLWKNHGIPFLVIEPAKNEYRALVQSIPDLQVFTPGKSFISPFVFNPFLPPSGVRLETYKSTLKTAFAAGVSMTTPLDKIFEETISNCYSDFRWLDTYTVADKGRVFNISDFIKCFQQTFENIGYTGDAKNIGRAGLVRLNGLVNLFDSYHSIPIEDMLTKPTVIELAAIENSDEKALIIALVLLSILAYVNANYLGEGGLRNAILLEEAHVLLDAETNVGQGDSNPSLIAQGLVKRMLAELRSYGVSLVIADQSPRKVTTDVVALTDMKLAFRLVERVDKQILGDSINMSDAQMSRLGRLKPGEAFFFFNKLDEPEEVVTPNYRLENNISITLSDDGIRELSTYWNDRRELLRPYPECRLCRFCQHGCDRDRRVLARDVARRLYVRNFKVSDTSFDPLKFVLARISRLIRAELNDEPFSPELLLCVKVHLWRRVRYGTRIPITQAQIDSSLRK